MPDYTWHDEKNELIKQKHGVSFEEVVYHLDNGDMLDDIEHPNQQRYPNQRLYIVLVRGYVHVVPFYRRESDEFLITAYPNSRFHRRYSDLRRRRR